MAQFRMNVKERTTKFLTALLVVVFGTTTWVTLSGLWLELPLLTNLGVPEGFRIGSYVVILVQAAAIGPLLFVAVQSVAPKHYRLEIPTIYIILVVGLIASFLLIFLWDAHTIWQIDEEVHSTALLVLSFFMALVDSTSNLTFLPFVSSLRAEYVTWYFIGEGLSSVIPSLVVLIQGEGSVEKCVTIFTNTSFNPLTNVTTVQNITEIVIEKDGEARFTPKYYYIFIFLMFASSATSFCLLRWLPFFQGQYEQIPNEEGVDSSNKSDKHSQSSWCNCFLSLSCKICRNEDKEKTRLISRPRSYVNPKEQKLALLTGSSSNDYVQDSIELQNLSGLPDCVKTLDNNIKEESTTLINKNDPPVMKVTEETDSDTNGNKKKRLPKTPHDRMARYIFLFTSLSVVSATTYGVLPSVQSYSASAYGSEVYLLAAAFAEMSVPVGFFLVMIRPNTSYSVVLVTSLGGMAAGAYCMATAVLSPNPPFLDQSLGKYLIVSAWSLQGLFFSYSRATIGWILRGEEHTRVLMMLFGGCTTSGAMLGAIILFPLVNNLDIFQEVDHTIPCPSNITSELINNPQHYSEELE